jgi:hypothetical protein
MDGIHYDGGAKNEGKKFADIPYFYTPKKMLPVSGEYHSFLRRKEL